VSGVFGRFQHLPHPIIRFLFCSYEDVPRCPEIRDISVDSLVVNSLQAFSHPRRSDDRPSHASDNVTLNDLYSLVICVTVCCFELRGWLSITCITAWLYAAVSRRRGAQSKINIPPYCKFTLSSDFTHPYVVPHLRLTG
jgi:hypothetical protein